MQNNLKRDQRILARDISMDKNPHVSHKNNNILVVGSPGSQKTLSYVLPNILNTYSESMVIVDVKGDLIKKTAGIMKGRGYDIHCLDLKNFKIGERYNPISLLETDIDISKFASIIFKNDSFRADPFWDDMSRLFLAICLQLLQERFPESKQTMESVLELTKVDLYTGKNHLETYMDELEYGKKIRFPDGRSIYNVLNRQSINQLRRMEKFKDHPKLKDSYLADNAVFFKSLLDENEKKNYVISEDGRVRKVHWTDQFGLEQTMDPESKALYLFKQFIAVAPSEKTLASILATVTSQLKIYASETIFDFVKANEIDFSMIGKRKTVLYLIVDDLSSSYDSLIEIVLYQLIQSLVKEAEESTENSLSVPVHFYLDDFATYYIPDMERLIASLRSRGIGMSLILQSETQLASKYGISAAKTIINSCDTYLYLGGTDIDTARSIALKTNNDLKNVLELPYGMEYVFQRNEKSILTNVLPINRELLDKLSKNEVPKFERHLKDVTLGKDEFQRLINDISVADLDYEDNYDLNDVNDLVLN